MEKCPRCGSRLVPSISKSKEESPYFRECPHCNTFVNIWQPQPQQYQFLKDGSRFKANFGAYGSAKTSASIQNIIKHILITPNGTGLVGANVLPQLEQTIKREFDQICPEAFIQSVNNQKGYYTFRNGYRLIWRPLDDPGKVRSLNLDMIVFVEGSEVADDFWSDAKTRLRNMAASIIDKAATKTAVQNYEKRTRIPATPAKIQELTVYEADWREQWVESNPDSGWVKQEVYNNAHKVYLSGSTLLSPNTITEEFAASLDPALTVHVASTSANLYLPRDYIKNLCKNKPQWWINRYVLSSFDYSDGLVLPSAIKNAKTDTEHILTTAPQPPRNARYILAHDYGLSDPAGIILAYLDPNLNKLVIYKEYKQDNNNVDDLSQAIKSLARHIPQGALLRPFIIDPKTGPKRDYNKKSLIDLYLEHNIYFEPASTPSVETGLYKLNTYFDQDFIFISPECRELIKELQAYSMVKGRPEDRNNHLIDPLRWIVMELPSTLENVGATFSPTGERSNTHAYDPLEDHTGNRGYSQPSFNFTI